MNDKKRYLDRLNEDIFHKEEYIKEVLNLSDDFDVKKLIDIFFELKQLYHDRVIERLHNE